MRDRIQDGEDRREPGRRAWDGHLPPARVLFGQGRVDPVPATGAVGLVHGIVVDERDVSRARGWVGEDIDVRTTLGGKAVEVVLELVGLNGCG
jgi:hypothetical protein